MKKRLMFVAVLMLAASAAFAGITVTAKDVVDRALAGNPGLASSEKMAGAYSAAAIKPFWLENPMVGVDYMGLSDRGLGLDTAMQKELMISQKIPFPTKIIWKGSGALADADYYRYMYQMKKNETARDARAAYYSLYKTTKDIETTKEAVAVLKQLSGIAFAKYNQGMAGQQDVVKADLEYSALDNALAVLNRQKETDIQRLREVTGDAGFLPGEFVMEDPEVPALNMDFEKVKELVLLQAPSINMAKAAQRSAENMRNMAINDIIPDLNIEYRKVIDPGSDNYRLMFSIEVPVWFANNQAPDIAQKLQMSESALKAAEQAANRAVYEAKDHYEIIMADGRTLELYRNKLIPQAQTAVKTALSAYQTKRTEFMSLLDSQRMLLEMKKDYYMYMTEYLMHFRMLEELCGQQLSGQAGSAGVKAEDKKEVKP